MLFAGIENCVISPALRANGPPRHCGAGSFLAGGRSRKRSSRMAAGRLARALRRLGLKSRVELARLMPPG